MDKHKALTNAQRELLRSVDEFGAVSFHAVNTKTANILCRKGLLEKTGRIGAGSHGQLGGLSYVITDAGRAALSSPLGKGDRQPVDSGEESS